MSIHRTKTGKWEVRYREGRRNRSKTFDLKEDARAFEAEARVRRQRGEHVRRSSDAPTLRDFAADWMDRRRAAGPSEMTLKANTTARAGESSGKPESYEALARPDRPQARLTRVRSVFGIRSELSLRDAP